MSMVLDAPAKQAVTLDEIDAAASVISRMKQTIADLQAENERLQAALAKFDDPKFRYAPFAIDAWFAPGMEDYDDYDNVIAAVRARQADEDRKARESADANTATR